jgi:TonB family protein
MVQKEKKTFEIAVGISVLLHILIFGLLIEKPFASTRKKKITYYVDLMNFSPGGGGIKNSSDYKKNAVVKKKPVIKRKKISMKELTTEKAKLKHKKDLTYSKPVKKIKKRKKKIIKKTIKKKKIIRKTPLEEVYEKFKKGKQSNENGGVGFGIGSGNGNGPMIGSFPYSYYVEIVKNRVSSNWITATGNFNVRTNYIVIVGFTILKNGGIKNLAIEKSSGINSLDTSALRAVKYSIPFPPLPKSYDKNTLSVFIQFVLNKNK